MLRAWVISLGQQLGSTAWVNSFTFSLTETLKQGDARPNRYHALLGAC